MVSRLKFILKPRPRLKRYRFGGTSYCWTITMKVIYFIQLAIIVAVFMWSIKIIFSNFVFNDERLVLLEDNVGIKGRSSGQRVELPMPEEELFPSTTTMATTRATTTIENVTTTSVSDSTMATDGPSIESTTESESESDLDDIGPTTSIDMSTDFLSFFTENPTTQSEMDLGTTQSEPADSTRSNDADSESSASTTRPEIGSSSVAATTTFASTLDASSTEVPESLSTDSGSSAVSTGSTIDLQTGIPETGGPSSTAAIDSTFDLATEVPDSTTTDIPLVESPQTTTTTTTIGDTFDLATEVPPSPSPEIPSTDFSTASSVASFGPAETMAVPTTESLAYTEGITEQAEVTDGQADSVPTSTANTVPTAFETFDDVSTPPPDEPITSTTATAAPTESTERIDFEVDRTIPSSFDQNGATTTTTSSTTVVPTSSASASALTEESNIEDFATTTTTLSSNTLPSVDVVTSRDESTIGPGNSITTRSVSDDVDDDDESTTTPVPTTTTITPTSIATDVPDSGSDVPVAVNTTSRSFVEYSSESSGMDSDTTTTTTTAPSTVPPNTEVTTSSPTMTTTTTSANKPTTSFSKTAPAKPNHHNHNHRPKWMRFWPNNPPTGWNAKLPPCPPPGPPSGSSDGGWGPSDQQEPAESSFFGTAAAAAGGGQSITSQIHKLWTRMFRLNQFRCEISQERRVIQYGLIQALDQYRAKLSKEILALSETLKQDDRWYWPNMMPNSNKVQEELIRLNQLLQLTTQYFKVLNRFNYFEWLQN